MVFATQFVYVIVLHYLLFPCRGRRAWALISECKIDQADLTDYMSSQPTKLMEKISLYENFKFEKCYTYDDFLSSYVLV